jgi:hypothetical protein
VSRLDARTGRLQATIPVTNRYFSPTQLTLDADAVWIQDEARLWRLDPATNTIADRTGDWEIGGGLAVVDGLLWLSGRTRPGAGQIVRVDPSTSRVVDRFPTGGDGVGEQRQRPGDPDRHGHQPGREHLPDRRPSARCGGRARVGLGR